MNTDTTNRHHLECGEGNCFPHDTHQPQGKITLQDGRVLECYPKATSADDCTADSEINDTTGCLATPSERNLITEEKQRLEQLFRDNAFYLLAHRERILGDSRMFLTPVAVQSGLAYSGTGGFQNPTVGVYLEWWEACAGAMRTGKDGERSLVYRLAGSPLSGANSCSEVLETGESRKVTLGSFRDYWKPFIKINNRYTAAKSNYQCYTLQQLLDILRQEDNGDCNLALTVNTIFMQNEICYLKQLVDKMKRRAQTWQEKYIDTLLILHDEEVRIFYKAYETFAAISQTKIENLGKQRRQLKADLKSGKIDNIAYQRAVMPLNKRIGEIQFKLTFYRNGRLREIFPEVNMSIQRIERYINGDNP